MTVSFVGSLVASALLCAVLAYRVDVGAPPLDESVPCVDELETTSAWVNEVWLEGEIEHVPCDLDALTSRLRTLDGAVDEELRRERSRVLIELRRCGGSLEDPQCAMGPDGCPYEPPPRGSCG